MKESKNKPHEKYYAQLQENVGIRYATLFTQPKSRKEMIYVQGVYLAIPTASISDRVFNAITGYPWH